MCKSFEIAEKIKVLLKKKNKTAKDMLEELKLSATTLAYMKTSYPQINNLTRIADYLDVSLDYLMGRTDIIEINKGE